MMRMTGRNKEALFRIILLGAMEILLIFSLISGEANRYVHPRMNKYIILCTVLLTLMILFELPQLIRMKHRNHVKWYGVIALPMITLFILPRMTSQVTMANSLTGENTSVSSLETSSEQEAAATSDAQTQEEQKVEATEAPAADTEVDSESSSSEDISSSASNSEAASQEVYEDGYTVQDDEFGTWFLNVFENMNDYEGKTVTLKAQVYHDERLQENEMVAVRGIMTCCIADLEYYGYVCRGEGLSDLEEDSWVWVTGTLHVEDYLGMVEPTILVTSVSEAEPPAVEYSYFY